MASFLGKMKVSGPKMPLSPAVFCLLSWYWEGEVAVVFARSDPVMVPVQRVGTNRKRIRLTDRTPRMIEMEAITDARRAADQVAAPEREDAASLREGRIGPDHDAYPSEWKIEDAKFVTRRCPCMLILGQVNLAIRGRGHTLPGDDEPSGRIGWGTWIRTKINGVRVRRSTIELFPNRPRLYTL